MYYRAVGNRCAVDLDKLCLPVSHEQALTILEDQRFKSLEVNLADIAGACIGKSEYGRGAPLSQAPNKVDCSGFVKWLYGLRGIWLPRRTVQQREFGNFVEPHDVMVGDLIFTSEAINYYVDDPSQGIGHVSMVLRKDVAIHATWGRGVVERDLNELLEDPRFRGVRRYIPRNCQVRTFETPLEREVETSDDIRWIILQALPECKV